MLPFVEGKELTFYAAKGLKKEQFFDLSLNMQSTLVERR